MLSFYGRTWQRRTGEWLDGGHIALVIAGMVWLIRRAGWTAWWHLVWSIPLFIWLPLDMPVIVERIHFLVFGLFGFLSVLALGLLLQNSGKVLRTDRDGELCFVMPGDDTDVRPCAPRASHDDH